jgi:hypothetical protein
MKEAAAAAAKKESLKSISIKHKKCLTDEQ